MNSFTAALQNEFYKIYRKKKTAVIIILTILVAVIGQLIVSSFQDRFGIRAVDAVGFSKLVLSFFVNTIMPLFAAMIIIDSFSGEFSKNTMKITLLRPVSRVKIYTAKVLAVGFYILASLMLVMLISLGAGLLIKPAENMLSGVLTLFLSYLVSFFPMLILSIIVAFMANLLRSGTVVFFLSIVIYIIFKILVLFFPQHSILFITSMLEWHNLWFAPTSSLSELLRQFLIMVSYGIIFFTGGFYLFDKKEY